MEHLVRGVPAHEKEEDKMYVNMGDVCMTREWVPADEAVSAEEWSSRRSLPSCLGVDVAPAASHSKVISHQQQSLDIGVRLRALQRQEVGNVHVGQAIGGRRVGGRRGERLSGRRSAARFCFPLGEDLAPRRGGLGEAAGGG